MKAAVYTQYGRPEVLQVQEIIQPQLKPDELLIRIHATTVAAEDCTFRAGKPLVARSATGLTKPKYPVLGGCFAGVVEQVGDQVTHFKPGDEVFGDPGPGFGSYAEYICLTEEAALAPKPANVDFGEAAAIIAGALTAMPFLRDSGKINSGQKVLILGASGSVGSAAVQLAKHFGAEVVGVCSGANADLVKSLGADRVIDYHTEDFTRETRAYDIIFDTVGKSSFTRSKGALKPAGIYLRTAISGGILFQMLSTSVFGGKKAIIAFTGLRPPLEKKKDLETFKQLIEREILRPVVDRTHPLEEIAKAHAYVEQGHKRGAVVLTLV